MKKNYLLKVIILILILSLTLVGCSSKNDNEKQGTAKNMPVSVILDYVPNTNHTGMYAALELGYYKDAGLDVSIKEPADGTTATLIAAGKGDFGISYQEDVTYALTAEEPLPIKAIATIIQHNTSGFASYKEKNITSPKDFEGKVYSGWGAPSEEAVIKAVMNSAGADPESIKIVNSDGTGYNGLKDKVDLMWFFWGWDGISSQMDGLPINYMELRELDSRLDYYTPVIIANNATLEKDPEMVKKFLAATKKGYEYIIKKPVEGAEILLKYAPDLDLEMLTKSQEYLKDKYIEDAEAWGLMKDEVWDNYTEFMVENKLIDEAIPADQCYTNEFLK